MFRGSKLTLAGCLAALLLATKLAGAFEDQWHLGGGSGAAMFAESETSPGPAVGLHGAYGLSDMFDLKLETLASTHLRDEQRFHLLSASAGLAYKVDVIEWIPYLGAQVGYYRLIGTSRPGKLAAHELGISVDVGVDYAISRGFGVGAQVRFHGFLHEPMGSMGDAPYFCGLLRAEHRRGW